MGWMTQVDQGRPAYRGELSSASPTLPELLLSVGYETFLAGKWHLTSEADCGSLPARDTWPTRRGFTGFFGILGGASSYTKPRFLLKNESQVVLAPGADLTSAITDAAIDFLEQNANRPRFLLVAYTAPHWPLHAADHEVEQNLPLYRSGYDAIREGRLKRLRELGLLRCGQTVAPVSTPAWENLPPDIQADQTRRMAVYATQVQAMDRGVGRILEAIQKGGRADNTLLLFLSDNGASNEELEAPPLPENLSDSDRSSYGRAWASVSNLPYRGFKKDSLQGGIATPFFLRWPARVASGTRITYPVHLIDVLPTCAEAAGVVATQIPKFLPDGVSLLPTLLGKLPPARDLFFEHEGGRALRRGQIKAVAMPNSTRWQLYDLENDPAETHDLAGQQPQETAALQTAWARWAEACGVLPLDSRDWGQRTNNPTGWKR
jgi:arylsulfatase